MLKGVWGMKIFWQKMRVFLYNKTTLMVIPHSEKAISSFHISNLHFFLISFLIFSILFWGFFFNFQIREKFYDFEYFRQENAYYRDQIQNIHRILPNITQSQNILSGKLTDLFDILGIVNRKEEDKGQFKLDQLYTISQLDNIEEKMENISSYINSFRNLFKKIPSIFPIVSRKYWFTSLYGLRRHPLTLKVEFHPAIDVAAFPGTPIQATADGVVDYAGWRGGYGIVAYVNHDKGYSTRYAHMARLGAGMYKGAKVRKGQIIGYVGTTGVSTGYHLHYEVRLNGKTVNPIHFIHLDRFWR